MKYENFRAGIFALSTLLLASSFGQGQHAAQERLWQHKHLLQAGGVQDAPPSYAELLDYAIGFPVPLTNAVLEYNNSRHLIDHVDTAAWVSAQREFESRIARSKTQEQLSAENAANTWYCKRRFSQGFLDGLRRLRVRVCVPPGDPTLSPGLKAPVRGKPNRLLASDDKYLDEYEYEYPDDNLLSGSTDGLQRNAGARVRSLLKAVKQPGNAFRNPGARPAGHTHNLRWNSDASAPNRGFIPRALLKDEAATSSTSSTERTGGLDQNISQQTGPWAKSGALGSHNYSSVDCFMQQARSGATRVSVCLSRNMVFDTCGFYAKNRLG